MPFARPSPWPRDEALVGTSGTALGVTSLAVGSSSARAQHEGHLRPAPRGRQAAVRRRQGAHAEGRRRPAPRERRRCACRGAPVSVCGSGTPRWGRLRSWSPYRSLGRSRRRSRRLRRGRQAPRLAGARRLPRRRGERVRGPHERRGGLTCGRWPPRGREGGANPSPRAARTAGTAPPASDPPVARQQALALYRGLARVDRKNRISAKTARLARKAYQKGKRVEDTYHVSDRLGAASRRAIRRAREVNESERIVEKAGKLVSSMLDKLTSALD